MLRRYAYSVARKSPQAPIARILRGLSLTPPLRLALRRSAHSVAPDSPQAPIVRLLRSLSLTPFARRSAKKGRQPTGLLEDPLLVRRTPSDERESAHDRGGLVVRTLATRLSVASFAPLTIRSTARRCARVPRSQRLRLASASLRFAFTQGRSWIAHSSRSLRFASLPRSLVRQGSPSGGGRTRGLAERSAVLARRSTTLLRCAPARLPLSLSQDRSLVAFGSLRSPATLGSFATAFRSASRNALTRLLAEVAPFVPALLRHAAARSFPNSLNARRRSARSSPPRTRPSLSERDDDSSLRARRRNPRPRRFTSVFCPECHRHGSCRAIAFVRFATDHCRSHYARPWLACRYPCEITPNAPSVRLLARTRTSRWKRLS